MKFTKKHLFLVLSVVVLAATTVYWSALSAGVHQHNSDQLADPALFASWDTFSQSVFPTQHTFLLKWPLFLLVQWAHGSATAFLIATTALCLVTVGLFAWLLSRIERRPVHLGLLLLAMSVVLLLVPIEPKPGSLLPVGMGMITTRNIEYIVFVGALFWLFTQTTQRLVTLRTVAAALLLALLFASDQLFIGLLFGGAVPVLIAALVAKNKDLRQKVLRVLAVGAVAVAVSALVFFAIRLAGILDAPAGAVGPYGLNLSGKDLALGAIYSIFGVLAQFGANPVSATVIATDLPGALLKSLFSPTIVAYTVNAVIAAAVAVAAWRLGTHTLMHSSKKQKDPQQNIHYFGLFMVAAAIAGIGLFVVTNHYYAVDARYMGLVFFAGFIVLAIYSATIKELPLQHIKLLTAALVVGCIFGLVGAHQSFQQSQRAYAETDRQNALIGQALQHHPVHTLIADYWRVYPITAQNQAQPLPLANCFDARDVLASKAWRQGAYQQSFAYLLTTEPTGTGYPPCELAKVRAAFGSPSDTLVVSGTAAQPKSLLLFYDKGLNPEKPEAVIRPNDTSLLRNLDELKDTSCAGRTVLQTVAHQDDDLLFMNPDLLKGVQEGDCVRTIYFTAGDAGGEEAYWLGREEGAKASYARMFGVEKPEWRSRDVQLSEHHQVKIARLWANNIRVSLIFMRLPDGNVDGGGFAGDHMESLSKLNRGAVHAVSSVDKTSTYTKEELLAALRQLMDHYKPTVVRTQAMHNHSARYRDHSDHLTVGGLTQAAFDGYHAANPEASIQRYIGYPIRERAANVAGEDLTLKKVLFFLYAGHDASTCTSDETCEKTSYKYYLNRQYTE